jgi:hypothetical protein
MLNDLVHRGCGVLCKCVVVCIVSGERTLIKYMSFSLLPFNCKIICYAILCL